MTDYRTPDPLGSESSSSTSRDARGRTGNSRVRRYALPAALFVVGVLVGALLLAGDGGSGENGIAGGGEAGHEQAAETTVWTCSMHPQFKLPAPGKCPICFMDLIPLEAGDADAEPTQLAMSEAAVHLAQIVTAPVVRRTVEGQVRTVGRVIADETRVRRITSWVGGRLDRLFVDFTGETVRRGEPLAEIYSPELYAAQAELIQAKQARERLEGSSLQSIRQSAETTVQAAGEKLRLLGISEDQLETIASGGAPKERITIHAPISGVVTHKNAVEGEYVKTGTPIYTIADLSKVWILLDIYESDLVWVQARQRVRFQAEAYPGETFEGRIDFIDPVLDPRSRTVKVRVEAENPGLRLKPDMFVNAVLHAAPPSARGASEPPLVIPATAPLLTGKRAVVYVRVPGTEKPTFEGREVVLGPKTGDTYIVESGLREGEEVVVRGAFKIDSEMQIQAKPSMMSPGGVPAPGHDHGDLAAGSSAGAAGGGSVHGGGGPHGGSADGARTGGGGGSAAVGASPAVREAASGSAVPHESLTKMPKDAAGAMAPLYAAYLELQRALAGDDEDGSRSAVRKLEGAVKDVSTAGWPAGVARAWDTFASEVRESAARAREAGDIEGIRAPFQPITAAFVRLEQGVGPPAGEVHKLAYCPMAFGDTGAYWIQTEDEISNPYFGSMMLRCGEFRGEFAARSSDGR